MWRALPNESAPKQHNSNIMFLKLNKTQSKMLGKEFTGLLLEDNWTEEIL